MILQICIIYLDGTHLYKYNFNNIFKKLSKQYFLIEAFIRFIPQIDMNARTIQVVQSGRNLMNTRAINALTTIR